MGFKFYNQVFLVWTAADPQPLCEVTVRWSNNHKDDNQEMLNDKKGPITINKTVTKLHCLQLFCVVEDLSDVQKHAAVINLLFISSRHLELFRETMVDVILSSAFFHTSHENWETLLGRATTFLDLLWSLDQYTLL